MKKFVFAIFAIALAIMAYGVESKVSIVGDTVISKDAAISESQGNLEVEGSLPVGQGAVQVASNGDVVITGRVILKNPDGGISMGAYGRPAEDSEAPASK